MSQDSRHPLLGILCMVLAMMLIPLMDVCAKLLTAQYHPLQVSWLRFASHVVWMLPLLLWFKVRWWRLPKQPGWQVARGACLMMATVSFFTAIQHNPIPDAAALFFVSPLIITLLSPWLLDEVVGWRRWAATAVGFAGVLVILQPGGGADYHPTLILGLAAGFFYALYIIITRRLFDNTEPLMTLFYTALVGCVGLAPVLPGFWIGLSWENAELIVAIGFLAVAGHALIILSCRLALASLVAPFTYTEMVATAGLNYLIFSYWPTLHVWLGIVLIVASGVFVSYREMRRRAPQTNG